MKSHLGHIQINIDPKNLPFYKELFTFLEWKIMVENETMLGLSSGKECTVWFLPATKDHTNDHDSVGANHFGINVPSAKDVDEAAAYLEENHIVPLFDTPRHRPEFSESPEHTYYQVMFASPDNLLFEILYTGPKSKA